ncbi:MAG: preprotein translocase subunit SecG [Lachnospiraceae bacterium]|nr:preprotein translocase subunit SecG [Lachnospiraceae bacterium]
MAILRTVITVLFAIDCIALVVIVLMQEGKQNGLGALAGNAVSDTYWGKNKARSAEGKMKTVTRICAILFIVLAIVLNMSF